MKYVFKNFGLNTLGRGFGSLALMDLLSRKGLLAAEREKNPLAPKPQQLPAKAKAVISIFCYGGVSHVDAFDPKPELLKRQGEKIPAWATWWQPWAPRAD